MRGVSDAPRLLIEELQPYNRLDPERMALVYVHRFSNQDKHRTSLNFTAAIEDPRGKPSRFGKMKDLAPQGDAIFRINEPLKEDTKLIRVPAAKTGPEPYMEVEGETAFDIAFGDRPPLKVEGIPPTLGEVIRVIRRFEPFFERLSA